MVGLVRLPPHRRRVLTRRRERRLRTLGLYAYYRGMATGTLSVVAPIAGASAIVPVVFGIATGDRPRAVQLAGIASAIVGVALTLLGVGLISA